MGRTTRIQGRSHRRREKAISRPAGFATFRIRHDHENKDAFTLAVFTDGDARHFQCSSKVSELTVSAGETRPRTYGGNYVTQFRSALEDGKGGILRLLWKRDGDAWRIGAFDAVVA